MQLASFDATRENELQNIPIGNVFVKRNHLFSNGMRDIEVVSQSSHLELKKVNSEGVDRGVLRAYLLYNWKINFNSAGGFIDIEKLKRKTFLDFRRDLSFLNSKLCLGEHEDQNKRYPLCPSAEVCLLRKGNPYCWHSIEESVDDHFELDSYWLKTMAIQELCELLGLRNLRKRIIKEILPDLRQLDLEADYGDTLSYYFLNGNVESSRAFFDENDYEDHSSEDLKWDILRRKKILAPQIIDRVARPVVAVLDEVEDIIIERGSYKKNA